MADEVVRCAQRLARDVFIQRFPGLHLVFTLDPRGDAGAGGFETSVSRARGHRAGGQESLRVVRIGKGPGNPYADRISVGRTSNCDIAIRDASVSKLHAYFGRDANGRLVLVDQSSSNGTLVNGTAALPGVSEPVEPGDVLRFGDVRATVLDAAGVYDLLQRER